MSELDGASDLLTALTELGQRLVLASSSAADVVHELLDLVDARAKLTTIISGSDAWNSKPAPDLIEFALGQVGPGDAVVIGDDTWDALAGVAAGVDCIGLRSGGIDAARLREAGAPPGCSTVHEIFGSASGKVPWGRHDGDGPCVHAASMGTGLTWNPRAPSRSACS